MKTVLTTPAGDALSRAALLPNIRGRRVDIDGVEIFYRESENTGAPTVLLLHGFPSSSHQYRRLIDALGLRTHIVAPDYPGFGYSAAPDPARFHYTFEHLADVMERFCDRLGLERVVMFAFDYGAPIGLRIAARRPQRIAGLIIQNGNAYSDGLSPMARDFIQLRRSDPAATAQLSELLSLAGTRSQYETGARDRASLLPDAWILDQALLEQPGRKQIQIELAFDYHSNVESYPEWQAYLRQHRPPTLITWGRNDPFFTEDGARAYLRDLPDAELHLFDAGHFALEEHAPEIALLVGDFIERRCR